MIQREFNCAVMFTCDTDDTDGRDQAEEEQKNSPCSGGGYELKS